MQTDVVTGAFGYSGAAIARELLAIGHQVRTLTGHPGLAAAGSEIEARPLNFADPDGLERDLRGAHTLYNTYWVRFPHGGETHATAVANSRVLFAAAARAGIQRIVHVSITHADPASPYPYFSGKAAVETYLGDLGVPHAIARPSILFGGNGVLLNNIAWLLRRLPVFAVGGRGDYRVRPIHVDDLARLCLRLAGRPDSITVDAVGPDAPTFRDMVLAIRAAVGSRSLIVPSPGWAIPPLSAALGAALRDVLLTREEYQSMADGLADSDAPSTGSTSLTEWIAGHGHELGRSYANELTRHYRLAGVAWAWPPWAASAEATAAASRSRWPAGTAGSRSSQIARQVPRSWANPAGRAKKKTCRCALPSPQRETWARAMCGSASIARAILTVSRPSSAARSSGRSARSWCAIDSSTRSNGTPDSPPSCFSRQCSSDQTAAWSAGQPGHARPPSPRRGGSGSSGGASGTTRSPSGSKGNTSHPAIRDSGSRPSSSAASIAFA